MGVADHPPHPHTPQQLVRTQPRERERHMLNSHVFFNMYNTSANVTLPLLNTVFGGVVSERDREIERKGERGRERERDREMGR